MVAETLDLRPVILVAIATAAAIVTLATLMRFGPDRLGVVPRALATRLAALLNGLDGRGGFRFAVVAAASAAFVTAATARR